MQHLIDAHYSHVFLVCTSSCGAGKVDCLIIVMIKFFYQSRYNLSVQFRGHQFPCNVVTWRSQSIEHTKVIHIHLTIVLAVLLKNSVPCIVKSHGTFVLHLTCQPELSPVPISVVSQPHSCPCERCINRPNLHPNGPRKSIVLPFSLKRPLTSAN